MKIERDDILLLLFFWAGILLVYEIAVLFYTALLWGYATKTQIMVVKGGLAFVCIMWGIIHTKEYLSKKKEKEEVR